MSDFSKRVEALSPERRHLLELLRKEKKGDAPRAQRVISRRKAESYPLSFSQQRLWFLDQLEPGNPAYVMPMAVCLSGRLSVAALKHSLDEILRRHDSLRATFKSLDGNPVQVIGPATTVEMPVVDLQRLSESGRESKLWQLAAEDARRPFDLTRGPVLRVRLLKLEAENHVLLISMHHIVSDGWSMGVFVQEMASLYKAFSTGAPPPLAELPIQYTDFASWQREWLQGEMRETHLAYWRQQLGGDLPVIELPADRARPAVQSFHGATQSFDFPRGLSESLKALGRSQGATLFMVLLTAFKALLHRYTGHEDIIVGSPIANRNRSEVEGLIGFFVNALVLRTNLSGDPTFLESLGRVREVCLGAYTHQDLPFEMLVEELQSERDLSRQPLFNILLSLQNAPAAPLQIPGLSIKSVQLDNKTSKFDLEVTLSETSAGLAALVEYNTDLFDATTITRLINHYRHLLQDVARNPHQRLSLLSLLSDSEQHQLLVEYNDTATAYPQHHGLAQLFEAQAAATPDRVAYICEDNYLSYGTLNRRANRLAHYLKRLGVGPEQRVGVCLRRSTETIIALLGIMKAGGAYVPVDVGHPVAEQQYIIEEAQVRVVLCERGWAEHVKVSRARVVCVEDELREIEKESDSNPVREGGLENTSHVMYTSGSTGEPKGVVVEQRQLLNRFEWMWGAYPFASHEVACQRTTVSFSVSLWEMLGPLLKGVPTVILSDEVGKDPPRLVEALATHAVTRIMLVPSLLRAVLENGIDLERRLPDLKLWIVAGEPFSRDLYEKFREALPAAHLCIDYGATEMHGVAWYDTRQSRCDERRRLPIGRPINNTKLYLLDVNRQPVPPGVIAGLYVDSIGLARGYLNRPDLTAEVFVPNPFSNRPGSRLYRTNDLAQYRPDGLLEYVGRQDFQVKIRGNRVEPGGIESVLKEHTAVAQAVVMARDAERLKEQKRLIAYVVPSKKPGPTVSDLRRFVSGRVPEYMVPSAFVLLDALPLLPNGKINRRALPSHEAVRPELEEEFMPPRTPEEEILAGIWADLLNVERIGVLDNFFELGGHSLLAARVASRIREVFGVDLPLRRLLESPTIADLAASIETARQTSGALRIPPIEPAPRHEHLPLSFAQQRLWFIDQLESGGVAYNIPIIVRLTGTLNTPALHQSFTEILRRHEVLRTSFALVNGSPAQVIAPARQIRLSVVDLQEVDEPRREAVARRLAALEAKQSFDLTKAPLLRVTLLRLNADEHLMLLTIHHIACDQWSFNVLIGELTELYTAYCEGRPSPLPELSIQYADFALWQRRWLQGELLKTQLAYWKQQLTNAPLLELPPDHPRRDAQSFRGAVEAVKIPQPLYKMLKELGRQEGVTLYMTLLAAFKALLCRYTGQEDITIGSPIANRTLPQLERLTGFFANTLALRTDLSNNPGFRQLLHRVRETCLGAYAHQDLPFEYLVEAMQPERNLRNSTPLFHVVLVLQNAPAGAVKWPGVNLTPVQVHNGTSKFDLTLELFEVSDEVTGWLEYNTDLFDASTIKRLIGHFHTLLEGIAANPDQRLYELPLLTEAECRELLAIPEGAQPPAANGNGEEQWEGLDTLSDEEIILMLRELLPEGRIET
jgi:amino acid adenylation domain-containing protein